MKSSLNWILVGKWQGSSQIWVDVFALGNDSLAERIWHEAIRTSTETRGILVSIEEMELKKELSPEEIQSARLFAESQVFDALMQELIEQSEKSGRERLR